MQLPSKSTCTFWRQLHTYCNCKYIININVNIVIGLWIDFVFNLVCFVSFISLINILEWAFPVSSLSNDTMEELGCPVEQEWCLTTPAMTLNQFLVGFALTCIGYPIGISLIQALFSKTLGPRPQVCAFSHCLADLSSFCAKDCSGKSQEKLLVFCGFMLMLSYWIECKPLETCGLMWFYDASKPLICIAVPEISMYYIGTDPFRAFWSY